MRSVEFALMRPAEFALVRSIPGGGRLHDSEESGEGTGGASVSGFCEKFGEESSKGAGGLEDIRVAREDTKTTEEEDDMKLTEEDIVTAEDSLCAARSLRTSFCLRRAVRRARLDGARAS